MSKNAWIQTYTGKKFNPLNPDPKQICVEDIAHALSMMCRYNGHCNKFYSVAEHSVYVSRKMESFRNLPKVAPLVGLLHDAAEGLGLCDIPKPIKPHLENYKRLESTVMYAVVCAFGIELEDYQMCNPVVKKVDTAILMDERQQLFSYCPPWSTDCEPLGIDIACWYPIEAEVEFLNRFNDLKTLTQ